MLVRDALRALLFNKAARGAPQLIAAGCRVWLTSCNRVSSTSPNFSRMRSSSAHSAAGPRFSRWARLRSLTISFAAAFMSLASALVLHGGEPRHNQIREALPANRNLPQDWSIALWASGRGLCGSAAAEGECSPSARAGRETYGEAEYRCSASAHVDSPTVSCCFLQVHPPGRLIAALSWVI